jgi:hypothetical protein
VNLVEWLKRMVAERRVEEVVDPKLPEAPPSKVLKRAVLAALRCVDPDGSQRPTMGHVVHMLEDDLRFRDVRRRSRFSFTNHHTDLHAALVSSFPPRSDVANCNRVFCVQELQLARDLSPHASSSWEESYAYERDEH